MSDDTTLGWPGRGVLALQPHYTDPTYKFSSPEYELSLTRLGVVGHWVATIKSDGLAVSGRGDMFYQACREADLRFLDACQGRATLTIAPTLTWPGRGDLKHIKDISYYELYVYELEVSPTTKLSLQKLGDTWKATHTYTGVGFLKDVTEAVATFPQEACQTVDLVLAEKPDPRLKDLESLRASIANFTRKVECLEKEMTSPVPVIEWPGRGNLTLQKDNPPVYSSGPFSLTKKKDLWYANITLPVGGPYDRLRCCGQSSSMYDAIAEAEADLIKYYDDCYGHLKTQQARHDAVAELMVPRG